MTTVELKLIQEATDRGFLTATKIIPAHYSRSTCQPKLIIPEGSTLHFNTIGDLAYLKNGSTFFESETHTNRFCGVIYNTKDRKWAEILEHEEKKLTPFISLTEFPKSGMCWKPTIELLNYLKSRESSKGSGHSINIQYVGIHQHGLVWNEHNIWTVSTSSSYKEYSIEELLRHIPNSLPEHVKHYPLTPEECDIPKKWCINITAENKDLIKEFLISKKDEYINYRDSWNPHAGSTFFYPQHNVGAYCVTGHFHKECGYTFITDQQFKKHVLTHTDKQQQIIKSSKTKKDDKESSTTSANSCKIQRLNITVRDTAPIRGIGLKCPKIQVKIGSGYLPD